ncbi:MAG: hypothetical protein ACKOBM_06540, partial [Gammaproteobacteria bacterium]
TIAGATVIDRFWHGLVRWATVEQPRLAAETQHQQLCPIIAAHAEGARVRAAFDRLSDLRHAA